MTKATITRLSYNIIGCAIKVHKALGPGLLESIYQKCIHHELTLNGLQVERQIQVPIEYEQLSLQYNLKLDLLVNNSIIVESKTVETLSSGA